MKIRLTKLAGATLSHIPVGYWVQGSQFHDTEIGEALRVCPVYKTSNKHERFDWFNTTEVVDVVGNMVVTKNSTWLREEL